MASVDSPHLEYAEALSGWQRARDFMAGADAVKKGGVRYLRRLQLQDDEEYEAYKERAQFFNASARTRDGLHGMVFRKDGEFKLPESLAQIRSDATLHGLSLLGYAKETMREVLTIGRMGTLIDWNEEEKRPLLVGYKAEKILNWRMQRIGGRMKVSLVVLDETIDGNIPETNANPNVQSMPGTGTGASVTKSEDVNGFEWTSDRQIRVFRLIPGKESWLCTYELWREGKKKKGKEELVKVESGTMSRMGKLLTDIPFVFHGPNNTLCCIDKPPLDDLVQLNLDHYRLSADHRHGLHFTALPTYYAFGVPATAVMRVGATTAWICDNHEAKAGLIEYQGQGLKAFESELTSIKEEMAVIGARLLEPQKKERDVAKSMDRRFNHEGSILTQIVSTQSEALTKALRWCVWWSKPSIQSVDDIGDDSALVELNTDFIDNGLDPQMLLAIVKAWQAGFIDHQTGLYNLQRGEMLQPGDQIGTVIERSRTEVPPTRGEEIKVGA